MAVEQLTTEVVSRRLIELSLTRPPVHSFNRQLVRIIVDTVGAAAATLWLLHETELVMCEEIEQQVGAVRGIRLPEEVQQDALRRAFEQGEVVNLADEAAGTAGTPEGIPDHNTIVFLPVVGLRGNLGVLRLVFGPLHPVVLSRQIQLAETLSGYYSLYSAQRILTAQHEERQHIDRLSKAILQLQHYSFARQLPEVIVNSTAEVARVDRAVLLTRRKDGDLRVEAVSSVEQPDRKSAWARLCCELGELVIADEKALAFFPTEQELASIEDEELREKVNSYITLTDAKSLMVFPLVSREDRAGLLIVESFQDQPITPFERVMCTVYAAHAGSALVNYRLFRNVPFSGVIAGRLDDDIDKIKRGRRRVAKTLKTVLVVAFLVAVVWFVMIHKVEDTVTADCFVEPHRISNVTAPFNAVVQRVPFVEDRMDLPAESRMHVNTGDVLVELRTDELELALDRELANMEALRVRIDDARQRASDPTETEERRSQYQAEMAARLKELEAKQREIDILRFRIRESTIRSSIDGIVTDPAEPLELKNVAVRQGEQLLRVGAFGDKARVRIAVPGASVKQVSEGLPVEIQLQAFLSKDGDSDTKLLKGEVMRLAKRSETYKNANVFMAEVEVDLAENPVLREVLRPGMTGKARIIKPEKSTYLGIYWGRISRKIDYWLF